MFGNLSGLEITAHRLDLLLMHVLSYLGHVRNKYYGPATKLQTTEKSAVREAALQSAACRHVVPLRVPTYGFEFAQTVARRNGTARLKLAAL